MFDPAGESVRLCVCVREVEWIGQKKQITGLISHIWKENLRCSSPVSPCDHWPLPGPSLDTSALMTEMSDDLFAAAWPFRSHSPASLGSHLSVSVLTLTCFPITPSLQWFPERGTALTPPLLSCAFLSACKVLPRFSVSVALAPGTYFLLTLN